MQTFLPYPDFQSSARILDLKRLGKQRIEALQILEINLTHKYQQDLADELTIRPWENHPAVLMWRGYEHALCMYGIEICNEWSIRGCIDTCRVKFMDYLQLADFTLPPDPHWIGNETFHLSHQSNLLRKDPQHYGAFFKGIPNDLPYMWPKGK